MRMKSAAIAFVVLGVAVASIVVVAPGRVVAEAPAPPTPIERFATSGEPDLRRVRTTPDGQIDFLQDSVSGDEYWVSKASGTVVSYFRSEGYESGPKGNVEPIVVARDYARKVLGDRAKGMTESVRYEHEGRELVLDFRRYVGDVRSFDQFTVYVNAETGVLRSVYNNEGTISVSLKPSLTRLEAETIARKQLGMPSGGKASSELAVFRPVDGEQHLTWVVAFVTGDEDFGAEGTCWVDAHNGTVVDWGTGMALVD